jgi:hypothetical protein
VGVEVALSVVLLIGAGLLFRTVLHLQEVDPGLQAFGVLTFRVPLPLARYPGPKSTQFFTQVIGRLEQLPGVRSASGVSDLPFAGPQGFNFRAMQHDARLERLQNVVIAAGLVVGHYVGHDLQS